MKVSIGSNSSSADDLEMSITEAFAKMTSIDDLKLGSSDADSLDADTMES